MKMKLTSKEITFFVFGISMLVGGCGSLFNEEMSWRKFYDSSDNRIKEILFGKTVYQINHQTKMFDSIGYARIKNGRQLSVFKYDEKKQFALINLDTGRSLKSATVGDFKKLGKAKSIGFYEFGNGILESVDFTSQNGVCRDFSSRTGITAKFTTNYYKQYGVFASTFGQANLSLNNGKATNLQMRTSSYPNTKEATNFEKRINEQLQELASLDTEKLGRFLILLCNRK